MISVFDTKSLNWTPSQCQKSVEIFYISQPESPTDIYQINELPIQHSILSKHQQLTTVTCELGGFDSFASFASFEDLSISLLPMAQLYYFKNSSNHSVMHIHPYKSRIGFNHFLINKNSTHEIIKSNEIDQ